MKPRLYALRVIRAAQHLPVFPGEWTRIEYRSFDDPGTPCSERAVADADMFQTRQGARTAQRILRRNGVETEVFRFEGGAL